MKDKEYTENLIVRYLNGNCTRDEQDELKVWIEESTDKKNEFLSIKDIWDSLNTPKEKTSEQLQPARRTGSARSKEGAAGRANREAPPARRSSPWRPAMTTLLILPTGLSVVRLSNATSNSNTGLCLRATIRLPAL